MLIIIETFQTVRLTIRETFNVMKYVLENGVKTANEFSSDYY